MNDQIEPEAVSVTMYRGANGQMFASSADAVASIELENAREGAIAERKRIDGLILADMLTGDYLGAEVAEKYGTHSVRVGGIVRKYFEDTGTVIPLPQRERPKPKPRAKSVRGPVVHEKWEPEEDAVREGRLLSMREAALMLGYNVTTVRNKRISGPLVRAVLPDGKQGVTYDSVVELVAHNLRRGYRPYPNGTPYKTGARAERVDD